MTPEQRGAVTLHMPYKHRVAPPELVAVVAACADGTDPRSLDAHPGDVRAVIARLLDAEQQLTTLRRIIATAVTVADDNPDYGLSAGELLRLLTGSGLDLTQDIADAEQLRDAEQLAGAR
jgi:hypothetical protein